MLLNCGVGEDFWESLGLQGDPTINYKRNQSWIFIERTDAEAPILWLPDAKNWLLGKDPDAGKDWRQEEKGMTEDEMTGLHHWLNGHEFEQVLEVCDGQGSLACCSPWGRKNRTWLRDWTELNWTCFHAEGKAPMVQSKKSEEEEKGKWREDRKWLKLRGEHSYGLNGIGFWDLARLFTLVIKGKCVEEK